MPKAAISSAVRPNATNLSLPEVLSAASCTSAAVAAGGVGDADDRFL